MDVSICTRLATDTLQKISVLRKSQLVKLQKYFPQQWKQIVSEAYSCLCYQAPIKRMPSHLERSWLVYDFNLEMNQREISQTLEAIGQNHNSRTSYLKEFVSKGDYFLINSTDVMPSNEGHHYEFCWNSQVSLLYLYS